MKTSNKQTAGGTSGPRRYPAGYEKVVPIALIIIGVAIAILLLIIFAVALGLFPGS